MYRRVNWSLLLLVAFVVGNSCNDAKRREISWEKSAEEKISLLGPETLLKNYNRSASYYQESRDEEIKECDRDLALLTAGLAKGDLWALKMLDASSKIPAGMLDGNLVDLGIYDECVAIHEKNVSGHDIGGRHCMYKVNAGYNDISLPLTLSICVPATCEAADIVSFINDTISIIPIGNVSVSVSTVTCSRVDDEIWSLEFKIFFFVFVGLIGFFIGCTVYDVTFENDDEKLNIFRQFSLRRSAAAILSTKVKKDNLPVIHGLRVLSMAWVVLGHDFILNMVATNTNNLYVLEWVQSWKSLYIFTAPFAVDTFFTVSGFLMTYLFLKQMPRQVRFNVPMYYLHRYLRLTPAIIALLIISIVFVPKIGSGPRWSTTTESLVGNCRVKWWPILLYVQNFVDKDNLCLGHLWYLAVDMQLFWISPIILYPLYKMPKVGLAITTFLLCSSLITTALIIGINKYPLLSFVQSTNLSVVSAAFKEVYEKPYVRAGPWLIGIILGYEMVHKERKLRKLSLWIGWLLTVLAISFCVFGTRYYMDPNYDYNVISETFFATVSRPVWAYAICWIIYACTKGHAGPVTKILSWRGFLPLSRLSYCIYLVHFVIQIMNSASLRTSSYFTDYFVWRSYFSDLIISIVIAFFFSLFFESPILVLEKRILRRR